MTKEEILKAIQACAQKLGRSPNLRELRRHAGITPSAIEKHFGRLGNALQQAGFDAVGRGFRVAASELLLDWAAVARKLAKVPTAEEYKAAGKYTLQPFRNRYGSWTAVRRAFRKFARLQRIRGQWKDVLQLIVQREEKLLAVRERGGRRRSQLFKGRPIYGEPILLPGMHHAPINEAGVMFAFGVLARPLGFMVRRWQTGFPDCVAVREMAKGQWQEVSVEVEMCSRNFLAHGHDPKKCDVIVCWVHNWPECPKWIEVVELRKVVEGMGKSGDRRDRENVHR